MLAALLAAMLTVSPGANAAGETRADAPPARPTGGAPMPAPARVVSINLCTDQLAMLLAAPGQLHSVTYMAADPRSSPMAAQAGAYLANHARAEEVFLMRPDLVLAGRFTNRATVDMLTRLGVPVEVLDPATSLDDIRARIAQIGAALGQEPAAARLTAEFDARLAALSGPEQARPRAALYHANGYTTGERSLAGAILRAAGFDNVATGLGIAAGGHLPLERLALTDPDLLVTGRRQPAASRAEDILDHPVIGALREGRRGGALTTRDWICGTPHVLRAIEHLATEAGPDEPEG